MIIVISKTCLSIAAGVLALATASAAYIGLEGGDKLYPVASVLLLLSSGLMAGVAMRERNEPAFAILMAILSAVLALVIFTAPAVFPPERSSAIATSMLVAHALWFLVSGVDYTPRHHRSKPGARRQRAY